MRLLRLTLPLAIVVVLLNLLGACTFPAPSSVVPPTPMTALESPPRTLTVFAAASLTDSFGELGRRFEAAHPSVKVVINLAGSQQLRAQLEQGAEADVFASANSREMNASIQSSLVVSGTQKTFALNRLIVIFPKDNPARLAALADLARPGLKLDIAEKAVPVGQYTLDALDKLSRDPAYGTGFKTNVLKNVVSYENDVKAVLSKVSLGEADAGFVYATDVTAAVSPRLGTIDIPDEFNRLATYPIAPLARAPNPELAKEFVDLVLSDSGQQVLARYGFIPVR
jgi:molybdate transport system substrate-binding protein